MMKANHFCPLWTQMRPNIRQTYTCGEKESNSIKISPTHLHKLQNGLLPHSPILSSDQVRSGEEWECWPFHTEYQWSCYWIKIRLKKSVWGQDIVVKHFKIMPQVQTKVSGWKYQRKTLLSIVVLVTNIKGSTRLTFISACFSN